MVLLVLIIKRGVIDNGGQQMLNMFIDQMSHLLMEPSQIEVLTRTYYNVPSVHKVEPLYCVDNSDCRGVRSHFRVRREVLYIVSLYRIGGFFQCLYILLISRICILFVKIVTSNFLFARVTDSITGT